MMNWREGISVVALCGLLTACGNNMSDLEGYIAEVNSRKSSKIEPLPEIRPYETFIYAAEHLRDPFTSGVADDNQDLVGSDNPSGGLQPDRNRRKEALESFPLDSLDMVGTLEFMPEQWALVVDPDGLIHRVKIGNYMGQNYGRVVSISEDRIDVVELVPDGLGGWMERPIPLALDE